MKKISAYFAVLLVLAAFGMTIFAHAHDIPPTSPSGTSEGTIPEVSSEYEVPISIPGPTAPTIPGNAPCAASSIRAKSSQEMAVGVPPPT